MSTLLARALIGHFVTAPFVYFFRLCVSSIGVSISSCFFFSQIVINEENSKERNV